MTTLAKKIDIAQVFIWASNILDTHRLSLSEQAIFFNVIKLVNRNYWKPVNISAYKFAQTIASDLRTVKKVFTSLVEKKIIYFEITNAEKMEGVLYIGYISEEHFKNLIARTGGQNGGELSGKNGDTDKPVNNSPANAAESPGNDDSNKTLADF